MRATWPLIALAALGLSACSKKAEEPEAKVTSEAVSPKAEVAAAPLESEAAPVSSSTPDPAPAAPSPTPTATATPVAGEIPSAILGRWGLVPKDCTSKLGDAKGLLTVSPKQLKFYEAVAKLNSVKELEDSRVRGTFGFSGEGQAWTLDVVLDVSDSGRTLTRRDYGKDAAPGPLTYTRCA